MLNWINKKRNKKGFTLVELVVVIAILGILAAIAVPKLSESRVNAAISAHNANVRTLESSATLAISEGSKAITWDGKENTKVNDDTNGTKGWGSYLQTWPEVPTSIIGNKYTGVDENGEEITIDTILAGTKYNVEIKNDGTIIVKPAKIVKINK